MVYLSELKVDARRQNWRRLFANSYDVHRWLYRAFPHRAEGGPGRVLYRIEPCGYHLSVLVQSELKPDWSTFIAEGIVIRGPKEFPLMTEGMPLFRQGQILRFRLLANPTVCRAGKRYGLFKESDQVAWLERKGRDNGFALVELPNGPDWINPFGDDSPLRWEVRVVKRGYISGQKSAATKSETVKHLAVQYDGMLRVVHPEVFSEAVRKGLGAGKGFGFGLLSLAPIRYQ